MARRALKSVEELREKNRERQRRYQARQRLKRQVGQADFQKLDQLVSREAEKQEVEIEM